jgi:signal transduction histidine kinase
MSGWGSIGRPLIVIITVALISMTIISSLIVYTAQQTTASRIDLVARQTLREDLVREAQHASSEMVSSLQKMEQTLSATALLISESSEDNSSMGALRLAGSALNLYTDNIVWLLADGQLAYTTRDDLFDLIGTNLSDRRFFEVPFATNRSFIAYSTAGLDDTPSFVVAAPVPNSPTNHDFNGLLAAIVPLDEFDHTFFSSHTLEEKPIMVITRDGIILAHPVQSLLGQNISNGEAMQIVSEDTRGVAENNFQLMAQGRSGVLEYRDLEGENIMVAYEPVMVDGVHTLSVAVFQPTSTVREPFIAVFEEQQNFTLIATVLIAAISAIFIGFILMLNRRLFHTVGKQDKKIVDQLSELRGAYDRLKEQDVIKDEFINIAAHELRTPILPIVLSAETLADSIPENENIKIILRNANRITKLTNDILDVSRIESNTFKLQKQKINIRKLVEEVIQDAKLKVPVGQDIDIVLESTISPSLEEISVDRSRINQVLVNLIDNAVNFTEKGTIRVSLELDGTGWVKVNVADPGKGIDPLIKEKLFGKFVSKSDRAKGTGLGLYLSKAIVEAHGGTISGENNPKGEGAIFSFTLPIN